MNIYVDNKQVEIANSSHAIFVNEVAQSNK